MTALDRPGIFKATIQSWCVRKAENSKAVAISMEYVVVSQLDGDKWEDWTQYDERYRIYGDTYVVKKDGKVNLSGVEQLAAALGWDGNLASVLGDPPDVVVQINVKEEAWMDNEGTERTSLKVKWLNPGDYTPEPRGESDADVKALGAQYGSLLRAAAAGAARAAGKTAATKARPNVPSGAALDVGARPQNSEDDIPF